MSIGLLGVGCLIVGLFLGLNSEFSSRRLISLLVFDGALAPLYGTMEYRIVAMGYALIIGSACLLLRKRTGGK